MPQDQSPVPGLASLLRSGLSDEAILSTLVTWTQCRPPHRYYKASEDNENLFFLYQTLISIAARAWAPSTASAVCPTS